MARPLRVPPSPALEDLYRKDEEAGLDPLGLDSRPPPGPPLQLPPLHRPIIPPVDWREEEAARARESAEKPADPETSTPNLDQVRHLKRGAP